MSLRFGSSCVTALLCSALLAGCGSSAVSTTIVDPLDVPQNVPVKSPAEEEAFLRATEAYLGLTIEEIGWTRSDFLIQSYRWCASLAEVGRAQAYETMRDEVELVYPPDQVDFQVEFIAGANRIIEEHLCS